MFSRAKMLWAATVMVISSCSFGLSHAAPALTAIVGKKVKRGLFNGRAYASQAALHGCKGAAITCAQQKRNAIKRRNQQRHKRAVKT